MYLKKELYELICTDESIFNFIQENALYGLLYWDLEDTNNVWINPKLFSVLGYITSVSWQKIITPNDLRSVLDNLTKHYENSNQALDQVIRYIHKDGSIEFMSCRCLAIRDKTGTPIRMLGGNVEKEGNKINPSAVQDQKLRPLKRLK